MSQGDQGKIDQRVQWGPDRRTGTARQTFPLAGEQWTEMESDQWYERLDLREACRRYYQREQTDQTGPCLLTVRARDLSPEVSAPQRPAPMSLREDVADALRVFERLKAATTDTDQGPPFIALERLLLGIQAQVEQG